MISKGGVKGPSPSEQNEEEDQEEARHDTFDDAGQYSDVNTNQTEERGKWRERGREGGWGRSVNWMESLKKGSTPNNCTF